MADQLGVNAISPTHTYQTWPYMINIVGMGEGDTFALIFPIKLTLYNAAMATILVKY